MSSSSSSANAAARVVPNCVQHWRCDKCGASDYVEYLADEDAYQVMQDARAQHQERKPGCDGLIRFRTVA